MTGGNTRPTTDWEKSQREPFVYYIFLLVCRQVLGKVPTISIDKTDGCQMYLSPESLNVELISSKSSEMNVMVPKGNGDYVSYIEIFFYIFWT